MIRLEHINKTFFQKGRTIEAVRDVNLHIRAGEIYGIIGFSGAGKSTLVRCINLLERPTSGKVYVQGEEITALPGKSLGRVRQNIGMIFQHFNLMPSRTVFDNIDLPLKRTGLTKVQRQHKIARLLDMVDLQDKQDNYPSQLSGGQQQRVAIARALCCDPKVLLCDEATSALDPQTTEQILSLLKKLNAQLKLTIVVITHQMSVVKDLCDRAAVMEDGRIVEENSVYNLFAKPEAKLTKRFLDTASNLGSFLEIFDTKGSLADIAPDTHIWHLTYTGASTGEALMTEISVRFKIRANILYGNIEYIKGVPLGKLAIHLSGDSTEIDHALDFIRSHGVAVEMLK